VLKIGRKEDEDRRKNIKGKGAHFYFINFLASIIGYQIKSKTPPHSGIHTILYIVLIKIIIVFDYIPIANANINIQFPSLNQSIYSLWSNCFALISKDETELDTINS
jgi:hypothetical protein